MAIICPTITATEPHSYRAQMERLQPFAKRVHIDVMDGQFAPSVSPSLQQIWWPKEIVADIHLMYQRPMEQLEQLVALKPHLVIIHNEAEVHHMDFAAKLHRAGIKAGLAILADTPVEHAYQIMHSFDHVLIFSGHLGYQGGVADLRLLDKVQKVGEHYPDVEIGWDGGIDDQNIQALAKASVDVLNVGSFIKKAENPADTFKTLETLL